MSLLALFCYHVGQLDDTDERDARYFGRGIGAHLLDEGVAWARDAGFAAVVAKGLTSLRPVVEFMGGLSAGVYAERHFVEAARYHDPGLRAALAEMLEGRHGEARQTALRKAVEAGADLAEAAQIAVCVLQM